jgi:hypothetical protein
LVAYDIGLLLHSIDHPRYSTPFVVFSVDFSSADTAITAIAVVWGHLGNLLAFPLGCCPLLLYIIY